MRPLLSASCCCAADMPVCSVTKGILLMALYTMPAVSLPGATASLITGAWVSTIEPNTVINITGNSSENTMDVGLRSVANKLYFEIVKAALIWLDDCGIGGKDRKNVFAQKGFCRWRGEGVFHHIEAV